MDNEIIDRYGAEIGAIGVAVYAALARHANRETGRAFPAYKTIAGALGLARNTVITAIRRLEEHGLITVEPQTDDAGNPIKTNIYTLCDLGGGGSTDEPGGVQQMNPGGFSTLTRGVQQMNGGGSSVAYEQDSMNKTHVVGGGARAKKANGAAETPPHVAYLLSQGMGAAAEFAQLDPPTAIADFDARRDDNIPIGTIVEQWRAAPPQKGMPYARRQTTNANHAARPAKSTGRHGPTGRSDIVDPGWRDRLLEQAEQGELDD